MFKEKMFSGVYIHLEGGWVYVFEDNHDEIPRYNFESKILKYIKCRQWLCYSLVNLLILSSKTQF